MSSESKKNGEFVNVLPKGVDRLSPEQIARMRAIVEGNTHVALNRLIPRPKGDSDG